MTVASFETNSIPYLDMIHNQFLQRRRGHPQNGQRGNQRGYGGLGNSYASREALQLGNQVARQNDTNQFYAFMVKIEAETYYVFITSTILVSD